MKDNFILYTLYYDAIMVLTDEQAGQLLKAIYRFAKTGKEEEMSDPTVSFAYVLIITQIKESSRKYNEKCQRLRENINKRWKDTNVSEAEQENTKEYKSIELNTKEYNSIHKTRQDKTRQDKKEDKEDEKKDELSLFEGDPSNSSIEFSSDVYSLVMDYWNNRVQAHGSAMKKIQAMTDRRKSAIRARMREHRNDLTVIYKMIVNAVTSDFLNGKNSRNKIFTFDALFAPDLFQKTLEGNFNDPKQQQPQSGIGQLMEQQSQETPQDRQQQQRERFAQMIEAVRQNPNHRCRTILEGAARNGTLKALGISWEG